MKLKERFNAIKDDFQGEIEFDVPLSRVTWYRIGGPASILVSPRSLDDLKKIHSILIETGAPFFILGAGSNVLFSDSGFQGVVIRSKFFAQNISVLESGKLEVGASVPVSVLLKFASEKGLGGLERLVGIPGLMGGVVKMNAGTHLGELKDIIEETSYVEFALSDFCIKTRKHSQDLVQKDFTYRESHFLSESALVLSSVLRVHQESPDWVRQSIDQLLRRRKETQPVDLPSCGSVFMNPSNIDLKAWQVIDRLGLRGHQIGMAQISQKHSNFIVNLGGAKASDVLGLIELIQHRAKRELNIEMTPEVKIIS